MAIEPNQPASGVKEHQRGPRRGIRLGLLLVLLWLGAIFALAVYKYSMPSTTSAEGEVRRLNWSDIAPKREPDRWQELWNHIPPSICNFLSKLGNQSSCPARHDGSQ